MKNHKIWISLCLFAVLLGAGSGCKSALHAVPPWVSCADLRTCESLARAAAKLDFAEIQLDQHAPPLFRIDDWEAMRLTIFLPVTHTNDSWFLAYTFASSKPHYSDCIDVYYFVQQGPRDFAIVGKRLMQWERDGIRRVGQIPQWRPSAKGAAPRSLTPFPQQPLFNSPEPTTPAA
jgi:hypothetical protein